MNQKIINQKIDFKAEYASVCDVFFKSFSDYRVLISRILLRAQVAAMQS